MTSRAERIVRGVIAGIILAATAALPAGAHHSYAPFDRENPVTIEGVIEQVSWVNPHVRITMRTRDGALYEIHWRSANALARGGVLESPLAPGDRVAVTGAPHRDPAEQMVTLISEVVRLEDGWRWSRRIPPAPLQNRQGPRAGP